MKFYPLDGGIMALWNVGIVPHHCMVACYESSSQSCKM